MTPDTAETLALRALSWIARDGERAGHFLGTSGAAASSLSERVQDPDFLASVLDFLLLDDEWIVAFCTEEGLGFDMPAQARAALPGGAAMHWT